MSKPTARVGVGAVLARYFGALPIVDATSSLRIHPSQADIDKAVKGDPAKCAFSLACKRQWASSRVLFFKRSAYVDLLGPKGRRQVERYYLDRDAQRLIKDFDAGKKVQVDRAFILHPPSKAMSREARSARSKRYNHSIRTGEHKVVPRGTKRRMRNPTGDRLMLFRHGDVA